MDETVAWYEGAGTADRRWLIADALGSTVAVTNASGAALQLNAYDEWGAPASSNLGRFQYTGQAWLPELGLYHYKARAYAPAIGRFMQPDPILWDGGMNLYAYVGNDPANFTDPWGLQRCGPNEPNCVDAIGDRFQPLGDLPQLPHSDGLESFWDLRIAGESGSLELARVTISDDGVTVTCDQVCQQAGRLRAQLRANDLRHFWQFLDIIWQNGQYGFAPQFRGLTAAGEVGAAALSCVTCFAAGTEVQTPSGPRPIEDIAVGDLVLAYDETTGAVTPKPVTALIRPLPKAVMDVSVTDAGGGAERFVATADHPWLVVRGEGETAWVETLDLKPGDRLVTADGRGAVFTGATLRDGLAQTYNLEVDGLHTFLVGDDGVVVHNSPLCNLDEFAKTLENLGGGVPRFVPTPKGAPQFIFPNGMVMRFDLRPGQFLSRQGPHINLQRVPGSTNPNIHVPVRPVP